MACHNITGAPRLSIVWRSKSPRRARYAPGGETDNIPVAMASLDLWSMLFVFMLATFVGFQVIQNVSRLLHTPLMSLTNAISAIAVVGSIVVAGERESDLTTMLGVVAVAASMTNIVSGFLITDRMLKMFREKGPK
jgi:proton-translocating NAD(P)+ transhydrogenase subunit alpha